MLAFLSSHFLNRLINDLRNFVLSSSNFQMFKELANGHNRFTINVACDTCFNVRLLNVSIFLAKIQIPVTYASFRLGARCPSTGTSLNIAFCWCPNTDLGTVPGHGH